MSALTLAARFWAKVEIKGPKECWPWTASLHDAGYGQIYAEEVDGKSHKEFSHRVAWVFENGPVPDGLHVLHRCDFRRCCNVGHMFLGSNIDNIDDKVAKGRQSKGEDHPQAKLYEDQISIIRSSTLSNKTLGDLFGVNQATIYDARKRRTWKHVL